jgi:hypothetical protein
MRLEREAMEGISNLGVMFRWLYCFLTLSLHIHLFTLIVVHHVSTTDGHRHVPLYIVVNWFIVLFPC